VALNSPRQIKKHFEDLHGNRSTWESVWQEVADFGLARRTFTSESTKTGEGKRTIVIYDNTMMIANDLLASGLHNLLSSTSVRWFHLEPDNLDLLQIPEVSDWYAAAEDALFAEIERPEAGFHPHMAEVYNDIAAFGNGALATLRAPGKGIFFQAMPLAETYIDEGPDGRVSMIFRKFRLNATQFRSRFGEGKSEIMDKAIQRSDIRDEIDLLQALIPNPIWDGTKKFGPAANRIKSMIIALDSEDLVEESTFPEMPISFARWNKDPGELYARGPGVQALSDTKMVNEMKRTTLEGAQKSVNPPLLVPDNGFITQLDMSPGGLTVYRAATQDPVREMYTRSGMNPDLGEAMVQSVQTNIRAAYHFDLLQILQDPRMSATQVLEISSRTQQLLSPIVGRLQVELLEPVIERSFSLALRMGKLPPIPPILAGTRVGVRYVSPVQRAQRSNEAQALLQAMNSVLQIAQLEPSAMDSLDSDAISRFLFEAWGVPQELLRDPQEVVQIRQARAAEQQQQQQFQQMTEGAAAAAPLLDTVMNAGQGA
jgi:hypothetical protein